MPFDPCLRTTAGAVAFADVVRATAAVCGGGGDCGACVPRPAPVQEASDAGRRRRCLCFRHATERACAAEGGTACEWRVPPRVAAPKGRHV